MAARHIVIMCLFCSTYENYTQIQKNCYNYKSCRLLFEVKYDKCKKDAILMYKLLILRNWYQGQSGLMVMRPGCHPGNPGSIPLAGSIFFSYLLSI